MLEFRIDSENTKVIIAENENGMYRAQFFERYLNHVSSG